MCQTYLFFFVQVLFPSDWSCKIEKKKTTQLILQPQLSVPYAICTKNTFQSLKHDADTSFSSSRLELVSLLTAFV